MESHLLGRRYQPSSILLSSTQSATGYVRNATDSRLKLRNRDDATVEEADATDPLGASQKKRCCQGERAKKRPKFKAWQLLISGGFASV